MAEDREAAVRTRRTEHLCFVREIQQLCADSPGTHARLRRGLGKDLDQVAGMHEFIAHWLPEKRNRERDRAYYAVAALIADKPRHAIRDRSVDDTEAEQSASLYGASFGRTLAESVAKAPKGERSRWSDRTRSRLDLLVRQSPTGLHRYLPSATRLLRQCETEPDWAQLLTDLTRWPWNAADIGSRWQQDYFRTLHRDEWRKRDETDAAQAVPEPGSPTV
ncbi:type I-E CRISPR-associated protein Cse2/CasB [Streptomyces sp. SL13]|uniref:Type I-E CRISPR-associated protein Cse2/CasB n=1 Tax=Streptantibioticus silvisoli TaxID=2705255 RepID=A0AA90K764_9ACTN|nr:type I-E CRISPR-associated protein Cse2/CasB [Streptantibioticus silvisoli]MDI5968608.1 type I-E CRISPR-associated protein Cse2/CasB [Streptantibioticus silvisoli]